MEKIHLNLFHSHRFNYFSTKFIVINRNVKKRKRKRPSKKWNCRKNFQSSYKFLSFIFLLSFSLSLFRPAFHFFLAESNQILYTGSDFPIFRLLCGLWPCTWITVIIVYSWIKAVFRVLLRRFRRKRMFFHESDNTIKAIFIHYMKKLYSVKVSQE